MMTRKSETEKRRKKAKKPISLVMEQGNQGLNGKDFVKVVQEAVQVLQSVQGILIMFPAVFVKKLHSRC
jgi:ABC-type phosphate transport system auxiliary subunit